MNVSLDGYIAAPGDDIGWSVPSPELHQWFNDRTREVDLSLYGRRLWELMSAHWPTADQQPDATPEEVEYARLWQKTPKVVFSTTLKEVHGNARLVTGDAVAEIRRLKAEDGAPMEIAGASLAGTAMRAGLVDDYQVVTHPVLLGGGTPFFSALDSWVNLRHVGTRSLPEGVSVAHYETRR
nr:dihydrofolate reductase family protein [Nocardioides sp. zg-DK7169]